MMLKATGHLRIIGARKTIEADTYTCVHCNAARYLKSNDPSIVIDEGGICHQCMMRICSKCVAKECLHLEKRLEMYERNQALFKAMGLEL